MYEFCFFIYIYFAYTCSSLETTGVWKTLLLMEHMFLAYRKKQKGNAYWLLNNILWWRFLFPFKYTLSLSLNFVFSPWNWWKKRLPVTIKLTTGIYCFVQRWTTLKKRCPPTSNTSQSSNSISLAKSGVLDAARLAINNALGKPMARSYSVTNAGTIILNLFHFSCLCPRSLYFILYWV